MEKDFVKFRVRERKDGVKAIFLSFYYKGKRHEESTRLYIIPEETREDKRKNKETWAVAETIRARRLMDLKNEVFQLKKESHDATLLEYWRKKIDSIQEKTIKAQWSNAYNQMDDFLKGKDIDLKDIDANFLERFKRYLTTAQCKGYATNRTLKESTQFSYFCRLKQLIRDAINEKYITTDPCYQVKVPKRIEAERSYLTIEELQKLIVTPCLNENVRRSFLFSCLTGLRRSDINKLTWSMVHEQDGLTRIVFHQKKTKNLQYLDLNPQAVNLMGERKDDKQNVFPRIPSCTYTNTHIKAWALAAGINKYLTFHSGRHTFATMLLALGTDLYTVSKLLGHANINTTQIYAKVLDKNKQEAVKRIPNLGI